MSTILFLGGDQPDTSAMAAAFARAQGTKDVTVLCGCTGSGALHPLALRAMQEAGSALVRGESFTDERLKALACDLVVEVGAPVRGHVWPLADSPVEVCWGLPDLAHTALGEEDLLAEFRRRRDEVRRLVADLRDRGYLAALLRVRQDTARIFNSLTEGIIAHDLKGRIYYFNSAAERITGYTRAEVINRECFDVFPGGLCGGKCSLSEGQLVIPDGGTKECEIATKTGERRRVAMTVRHMGNGGLGVSGVLTTFSDLTRERELARRLGEIQQYAGIVGRDSKMLEIYDMIPDLAESNVPVLIQGESGTGKELIAAAIHSEGPRAAKQFVPVNCGALPEGLLESELFGHVRGAFTGAIRDKKGRFELADGGTIFLDEIGDVSPAMQVKLLRVLQTGCFERVGSETTLHVDARVLSATNKNLAREIAAGRFREDLYYRLAVIPIVVPPLRERRQDIPVLAEHLLRHIAAAAGREGMSLAQEALDLMLSYAWPGNVREMQNWIQFALVKCKGKVIGLDHLPPAALPSVSREAIFGGAPGVLSTVRPRGRLTAESVQAALQSAGGNRVAAAKQLNVSRATLYRFLQKQPVAQ